MKNLIQIFLISFTIASCGDEHTDPEPGTGITTWKAESIEVSVTPIPIVLGLSFAPDFISTAEDMNYELELNHETGVFTTKGDYSVVTKFTSFPDMIRAYEGVSKTGFFTKNGVSLSFDKSLFDIHTNDIKWTDPVELELTYVLSENGDELMQEQIFENVNVQDGMNGNITLTSVWSRIK